MLLVAPFLAGILPTRLFPERQQTVGLTWLTGLLLSFCISQPIAIGCMMGILYDSFPVYVKIYGICMLFLALSGIVTIAVLIIRTKSLRTAFYRLFPGHGAEELADFLHPRRDVARMDSRPAKSEYLYKIAFLILLGLQLVMAVLYVPFDGDDAYYVVQSVLADQTDTMNRILPYTGYSTALDFRHALATWPLWIAFVSRITGIHAAIMAHTILPIILIPAHYFVASLIGLHLFRRRRDLNLLFLCFLCLLSLYGNVSIYTPETFFLMRTWQGKALVGSLTIPLLCYVLLLFAASEKNAAWVQESGRERYCRWLLLWMVNITSGFFSTSGILLIAMMLALGMTFVLLCTGWKREGMRFRTILWHKIRILILSGITCIPNAILVLMGLKLRPW